MPALHNKCYVPCSHWYTLCVLNSFFFDTRIILITFHSLKLCRILLEILTFIRVRNTFISSIAELAQCCQRMSGAIPPLPNTLSWRGVQLKKYRDNFTFTFTLTFPTITGPW
jgi:hypothetical protein